MRWFCSWRTKYHVAALDAIPRAVIVGGGMDDSDEDRLVQLATFVPPNLADQVRTAADKDERSVSAWIRRVLARELEQSAV